MAKKKPESVDTTEVATTQQVLKEGTLENAEGRSVATTEAVFQNVEELEGDKERGAHQAVFVEGEPRASDSE